MYKTIVITGYDQLSHDEVRDLWGQGVCLDDWDYFVLIENLELESYIGDMGEVTHEPVDYKLRYLLTSNLMYSSWVPGIKFRGMVGGLGIVYHA